MSENRYSRQILTLGKDSLSNLNNAKVLIIGLKGSLGMETLKNLVLQGVGTIFLQDDGIINERDSETGFYYHKRIGQLRHETLIEKLKVLNPYCKIEKFTGQQVDLTIYLNQQDVDDIQRPMILSKTNSNSGMLFNDFNSYSVYDNDGESIYTLPIKEITQKGLVILNENHNLDDNHQVIFKNITGEKTEFLMNKKWSVITKTPNVFQLKDFPDVIFEFINGFTTRIKEPIEITHQSYPQQLKEPTLMDDFFNPDFPKEQFELWKTRDISSQNPVVNAYFGALIASEAIKYITKKYQPISQWYFWEDKHLVIPDSIQDKNVFIVGSGAIGCELLKNLVMLGVKNITITDPDSIEESNLSRQFLFNQTHLNKSKSESAKETIETFKDGLNITALQDKMCSETEDKFDSEFYGKQDIIFNALDNYQARLYMDQQAIKYQLPLFESGTQGSKGNTQPVIPHLTEHYGASNDNEVEESYPVCTVKSFPNKPEHTIHWAKEKFDYLFNEFPSHVTKYVENPEYLDSLLLGDKNQLIEEMNQLFKYDINTTEGVIKYFIEKYHKYFYHNVNQLLHNFPPNKVNEDGSLFWSSGKRQPKPIINSQLLDYVMTSLNVFAQVNPQNYRINEEVIKELITKSLNDLRPEIDEEKFIASSDKEIKEDSDEILLKVKPFKLLSISFEKDNEFNGHIDWIHLMSSLRNENYQIESIDKLMTRKIAGKIIPAMATTTSMVASLITMEMLKYLNNESIDNYRSYFINSAINQYLSSEPIPPKKNDQGTTIWDKYEESNDLTIREFIEKWSERFGHKINMIVNDSEMVYSELFSEDSELEKKLSEVLEKSTQLLVAGDDTDELPAIYVNI